MEQYNANNIKSERKVDFEIILMLVFTEGVMKSVGFWRKSKITKFTVQFSCDYSSFYFNFLELMFAQFSLGFKLFIKIIKSLVVRSKF